MPDEMSHKHVHPAYTACQAYIQSPEIAARINKMSSESTNYHLFLVDNDHLWIFYAEGQSMKAKAKVFEDMIIHLNTLIDSIYSISVGTADDPSGQID